MRIGRVLLASDGYRLSGLRVREAASGDAAPHREGLPGPQITASSRGGANGSRGRAPDDRLRPVSRDGRDPNPSRYLSQPCKRKGPGSLPALGCWHSPDAAQRTTLLRRGALLIRGLLDGDGPGSATRRKRAASRPGHAWTF